MDILIPMFHARGNYKNISRHEGEFILPCKMHTTSGDNHNQLIKIMAMQRIGQLRIALNHLDLEFGVVKIVGSIEFKIHDDKIVLKIGQFVKAEKPISPYHTIISIYKREYTHEYI